MNKFLEVKEDTVNKKENYINNFEIFDYKNLGQVRTILNDKGEPWFCLLDILNILNIRNITDVKNRLNPEGLDSIEVLTNGGPQQMIFVDQGNLYMAIGRSRKPEAENFMNWVYREVLPSLNSKGYYIMHNGFDVTALQEELSNYGIQISKLQRDVRILQEHVG